MEVLKVGETALQVFAKRFTRGDEVQLTETIQTAQLILAVKSGDIADVQRLVECQGMDINARDNVCCWALF